MATPKKKYRSRRQIAAGSSNEPSDNGDSPAGAADPMLAVALADLSNSRRDKVSNYELEGDCGVDPTQIEHGRTYNRPGTEEAIEAAVGRETLSRWNYSTTGMDNIANGQSHRMQISYKVEAERRQLRARGKVPNVDSVDSHNTRPAPRHASTATSGRGDVRVYLPPIPPVLKNGSRLLDPAADPSRRFNDGTSSLSKKRNKNKIFPPVSVQISSHGVRPGTASSQITKPQPKTTRELASFQSTGLSTPEGYVNWIRETQASSSKSPLESSNHLEFVTGLPKPQLVGSSLNGSKPLIPPSIKASGDGDTDGRLPPVVLLEVVDEPSSKSVPMATPGTTAIVDTTDTRTQELDLLDDEVFDHVQPALKPLNKAAQLPDGSHYIRLPPGWKPGEPIHEETTRAILEAIFGKHPSPKLDGSNGNNELSDELQDPQSMALSNPLDNAGTAGLLLSEKKSIRTAMPVISAGPVSNISTAAVVSASRSDEVMPKPSKSMPAGLSFHDSPNDSEWARDTPKSSISSVSAVETEDTTIKNITKSYLGEQRNRHSGKVATTHSLHKSRYAPRVLERPVASSRPGFEQLLRSLPKEGMGPPLGSRRPHEPAVVQSSSPRILSFSKYRDSKDSSSEDEL